MLFNSYIFVFVFFPICLLGYYVLLQKGKPGGTKVFLTAMSLWFYGYFNLSYLLIMVCSIAGNYLFHRLLSGERLRLRQRGEGKAGQDAARVGAVSRRAVMILAVALNLGVLFYFKYFDFF
ncbi:MAG: MBOAT family protein, partial [Lachnospiraceae bacterium]|nr:MBOAT family protein [Lachnospiraceae bacterium]